MLPVKEDETNQTIDKIDINGVKYVREDQVAVAEPNGNRAVVVVDRGWIFAGDVTEEDGRLRLSRALHVFAWKSVGFAAMVDDPKKSSADLRKVRDVDLPAEAEIFRVPVPENWGL